MRFSLSSVSLGASLLQPSNREGAVVRFTGRVRDVNEGQSVIALQYEAFEELAVLEGDRIVVEALQRYPILDAACVHRTGRLELGEDAIAVEVSSRHRREAFEACLWIVDEVKARVPIWKKEFYEGGETTWLEPVPTAEKIDESVLYSRQIRLSEVGESGQRKLREAKVLVIGAGGLGCAALPYLVAAGVGQIGIIDFDRVKLENLGRQVLFTVDDLNQPKATVAAKRLSRLNPTIEIIPIEARFSRETARERIEPYDLILDCTDSLEAKFDLNEAAVKLGKRVLIGGLHRYEGQLQLIAPNGPCLACLWPEEPATSCVGTCSEVGVLGMVPGVVGALQASEAVKLLLGFENAMSPGDTVLLDLLELSVTTVRAGKRPECTICGMDPKERTTSMEVVPTSLEEYRVVDIREADERVDEPFPIAGADWMPLSVWSGSEMDDRPTLFVCRAGARSLRLTSYLRGEGKNNTFSLPGGVTTLKEILSTIK